MERDINVYNLGFSQAKTYMFVALFVIGNIVLPQLCHLIPNGGYIFLPIYFFTLIASYKYGLKVGLLTAVLSPVINNLLFGMPATAVLSAILIKSIFLAVSAAWIADKTKKVSFLTLLAVILSYQFFGSIIEWIMEGSLHTALADFRLGLPGMIVQLIGGYFLIRRLN